MFKKYFEKFKKRNRISRCPIIQDNILIMEYNEV